ncbi:MAG: hypothetical protein J3Q66DRAFT_157128 [Benniella sp.]|nr:MAG: hypothetical protein J3Q66DRAFT_157128 [Benniella sp.]
MSTTEPMINDTFGSLLRDRGSGVNASTFHPYPSPVFCLGLSAACNPPLQGTVTPTNTVFLAQPLERQTLESPHPTLPHANSTLPQHSSPQFLSSNQVSTAPSQLLVLQLGLQHAYHQKQQQRQHTQLQLQHAFILNQPKRERLQLQLARQDEEIQELQRQLATLQQQLLSQQSVLMNSGPQTAMQPWASEFPCSVASQIPSYQSTHDGGQDTNVPSASDLASSSLHGNLPLTIQSELNLGQSWQPHTPPEPLVMVPATIDWNKMETERQDRVETSKVEGKRPQKRFTDEQWRKVMSLLTGEDPPSYQTIAKKLGCSKSTVWRNLQKYLGQAKKKAS